MVALKHIQIQKKKKHKLKTQQYNSHNGSGGALGWRQHAGCELRASVECDPIFGWETTKWQESTQTRKVLSQTWHWESKLAVQHNHNKQSDDMRQPLSKITVPVPWAVDPVPSYQWNHSLCYRFSLVNPWNRLSLRHIFLSYNYDKTRNMLLRHVTQDLYIWLVVCTTYDLAILGVL